MEPAIMTGDAIWVKEVTEDELEKGDIISYEQDGTVITHRIVDIFKEDGVVKYRTKGDNNNVEDRQNITYDQIEGKYQFKLGGFGAVVWVLQSKITLIILLLIILIDYWNNCRMQKKRQIRRKKREEYDREHI